MSTQEAAISAPAQEARSGASTWRQQVLDAVLLLFALCAGLAATWYAYSAAEAKRVQLQKEQLTAISQAVIDSFYLDLLRSVEAVRATGFMVVNQRNLERTEFNQYAEAIMANAPTLSGLEWQPFVQRTELAAFEAEAKRRGFKDYRVQEYEGENLVPVKPRPDYSPILFAFPESAAQFGFDLSSLPGRRQSSTLAQEVRQPVATATRHLISNDPLLSGNEGFAITSAVFLNRVDKNTGKREEHLAGFVTGLILVENMFREAAFRADAAYLDIRVYDQGDETPTLIYSALAEPESADSAASPSAAATDEIRLNVDVATRPWAVVLRPRPQFYASQLQHSARYTLLGGGLGTLLLVFAIYATQRSRRGLARLQAATFHAEQRLSSIIDGTHAGTWEWHVPSGEVRFNQRWASMLGYTLDELAPYDIGTWHRLFHPDDLTRAIKLMELHLDGALDAYDCEARLRHKMGHWVWVLARGGLISRGTQGEAEWIAGTHLDISESKRLMQQVTDIRFALDAHAIVGITDAAGLITFANDKFCDVSKYSREELLGKNHSILNSGFHPREFFAEMWLTISAGKTWKGDIQNCAKDGSRYWVDSTIAPILGDDGQPEQYIAIRYEITEKKSQAVQLLTAKEVAEAASRAKSEFLATMSHEIRTPMNGILGMLKLLQHTEMTARQIDYTQKAEGATQALLGIINDILDFSKVEAGKLELYCQRFVLGDLLRELSIVLSANLGQKNVEVLFDVGTDVPPVLMGDPLRLRQILLNLAGNALKFTEQGEVVVGIRQTQRIENRVELEFSVRDTGIGIPADKLSYIFEGFSQAESSTTRRFGGSGLGLAISKRLVGLMGGELQVESALGAGSRFFFSARLELVNDVSSDAERATASTRDDKLKRVLIVDDNALARQVLEQMARSMGWQCDCLSSGEAALTQLARDDAPAYQIVLMDWRMPGLDGWETTRRLRALKRVSPGKPMPVVIMVTAAGREQLAEKTQHDVELLDGYLVKPITASMLYDAVIEATADKAGGTRQHRAQQGSERLAGLRLLVVEDNLLNQQVAQELLQRSGAKVEIAGGGLDGVAQALAAEPAFDAILMDMQMPDIDGLEATRRILAQATKPLGPIIAMTANAMESDKEACRAAGMVDHVGKPIDLDQLIATILRHVGRADANSAMPPIQKGFPESVTPTFEAEETPILDIESAVKRLGGNREFYDIVALAFRDDVSAQLVALKQQLTQGDSAGAMRSAHTIKGLAATVGAMALSRLAAEIEGGIKASPNVIEANKQLLQLEALFVQVLALLPAVDVVPTGVSPGHCVADTTALTEQLHRLATLIDERNMRSVMVFAEIKSDHGAELGTRLQPLDKAMSQLDFADARAEVDRLLAGMS